MCVLNISDPVPDESVGRQDLPLDETVANKKVVRLLLSSIGAKNGWFIQKSMEISNNQALFRTVLHLNDNTLYFTICHLLTVASLKQTVIATLIKRQHNLKISSLTVQCSKVEYRKVQCKIVKYRPLQFSVVE